MAKHIVKCSICGEQFDANVIPYVKTYNGRRYAHENCIKEAEEKKSQEQKDKEALETYIKNLLKLESLDGRIYKQINQYIKEYNYTYSGIHKALIYYYEVKHNSIEKANGGIGIDPFCYRDAYVYYYDLWLAQEKNKDKQIETYKPQVQEITILRPKRKIKKRKLFTFLDEREEEE